MPSNRGHRRVTDVPGYNKRGVQHPPPVTVLAVTGSDGDFVLVLGSLP